MAAHNASATIANSLHSVLTQTLADIEVIVVDDGSTDETASIVKDIDDRRVRLVRQPHRGVSSARNMGIHKAQADVVSFIDADDLWHRTKLERCCEALGEDPAASLVYSWVDRVETGTSPIAASREAPSGDLGDRMLTQHLLITASNITVRTAIAHACGGFDESLTFAEDWDFAIRVTQEYPLCVGIEEVLVYYHQHDSNATRDLRGIDRGFRRADRRWRNYARGKNATRIRAAKPKPLSRNTRGRVEVAAGATDSLVREPWLDTRLPVR